MASPMFQEIFGAKLVGAAPAAALTVAQKAAIAAAAAGLVGLISLFNSLGRIFWAALSDRIGRKNTYYSIFVIGIVTYGLLPTWGHLGLPAIFVVSICIILSMYGGGFSTVPAYLADIFGPQMVGAIHGRLITAWSVAGVIGPYLIANLRQFQIAHGVPHARVYDITLYIMAGLLFLGLICNAFVRPVHDKHLMTEEEVGARAGAVEGRSRFRGRRNRGARRLRDHGRLGLGRRRHPLPHRPLYRHREGGEDILKNAEAKSEIAFAESLNRESRRSSRRLFHGALRFV